MAEPDRDAVAAVTPRVTHGELFTSIDAVLQATQAFFDRCNRAPQRTRTIIGHIPQDFRRCTDTAEPINWLS